MKQIDPGAGSRPLRPGLTGHSAYQIESPHNRLVLIPSSGSAASTAEVATRLIVQEREIEWVSVIDYQVSVGAFQELEIQAPARLTGLLQFQGESVWHRSSRIEGDRRFWTVRLSEPRGGSYRLVLKGRMQEELSDRFQVPLVTPLGVDSFRQYLLVLNTPDRPVQIQGVSAGDATPVAEFHRWFSETVPAAVLGAYELRGQEKAVTLLFEQPRGTDSGPTATFEQHRGSIDSTGTIRTESVILVRSRMSGELELHVPDLAAVRAVSLNGQEVQPGSSSRRRPTVALPGSDHLQEVSVRWSWNPPGTDDRGLRTIDLPRLTVSGCAVVWSVSIPSGTRVVASQPSPIARSIGSLYQARVFAEELERLLPAPKGTDPMDPAGAIWVMESNFLATVESLRRILDQETAMGIRQGDDPPDQVARRQWVTDLLLENQRVLERHGLGSLRARADTELRRAVLLKPIPSPKVADQPDRREFAVLPVPSLVAESPRGGVNYFAIPPAVPGSSIQISIARQSAVNPWVAALLAGLVGAAAFYLLGAAASPTLTASLVLAAAGLFWCWKLWPEPVGPALLLLAILLFLARYLGRIARQRVPELHSGARGT